MSTDDDSNPDRPPASRLRRFLWPSWDQRKGMLRGEAWLLVLASYALLAFAYAWPQDWRNESPAYAAAAWGAILVRVLQYHLGLLLAVVALVAAFGRGRRLFLAAAPVAAFCLWPAARAQWPRDRAVPRASVPTLRVMSANLLMVNERTAETLDQVRAARPDVLLLQEYSDGWHRACQAALPAEYPHARFDVREDSFGVAVYSKLPFVDGGRPSDLRLGTWGGPQPRVVVRVGGTRDVALYNVHLLPPRRLDYTAEHRVQVADLLDALAAEPLPAVVAGDFNWTETTPQHAALLRAGVRDAWDLAGRGRGATWPENAVFAYLPGLRLDHLYLSRGLRCTWIDRGDAGGSDHRPLVADVAVLVEP